MSAVSEPVQPPMPSPILLEEWDDPAMAEFKRQEAEDRAAFGCSEEAREWLRRMRAGEAGWGFTGAKAKTTVVYDKPPIRFQRSLHVADT